MNDRIISFDVIMRLEWLTCCITDTQPYYSLQSGTSNFCTMLPAVFLYQALCYESTKVFFAMGQSMDCSLWQFSKKPHEAVNELLWRFFYSVQVQQQKISILLFFGPPPSLYPPKFNQITGLWLPYLCFVTFSVTYPILVCFFWYGRCQVGYIGAFRKTWNSVIVKTWR